MTSIEYFNARLKLLEPSFLDEAVEILRDSLTDLEKEYIRQLHTEHGQNDWAIDYHHGFGRKVRNLLRANGLWDNMLPDTEIDGIEGQNWDDYYVPVVEIACDLRDMPTVHI